MRTPETNQRPEIKLNSKDRVEAYLITNALGTFIALPFSLMVGVNPLAVIVTLLCATTIMFYPRQLFTLCFIALLMGVFGSY